MEDLKVFYITDDNGRCYDVIIGDKNMIQVALMTKDYIEKINDSEWVKLRVLEIPLEGKIHNGHVNTLTTIKLNGIPCRSIINNFYNLVEIVESYMDIENDYRKFTISTEYIRL